MISEDVREQWLNKKYCNWDFIIIIIYFIFLAWAPKELSEKQNSNKSIWIIINSGKRFSQKIKTPG